ncbi:serine protease [Acidovorax sp. sif1233]|uniref:S1 family peptidase n=1 Tax=Acidovorax sp. sif1233 TaxID=2854792 RepID=UPI001C462AC3|nr:serine protease [Acidovorax sp. sif1233]MBV7455822.1 serine protease [Acidovorax sp. sif1233]
MALENALMKKDYASTVALHEPEQELAPGEQFTFTAKRLLFEGANSDYIRVGAQNGTLLALSFRDRNGHHTYGSGVMVGPGLALCAAHVLHEHDFYDKLQTDEATLVVQAPLSDGGMLLWTVLRMALVPDSDLAVLSMTLSSPYPADRCFMTASLTTRMPTIGDVLTVTGLSAAGDGTETIADVTCIDVAPQCQFGRVIDRYLNGRDRRLPGPCLAVECAVPGGTSGGPVFDSRGYLVGLLSASYDGAEISFVSHIWPALVRAQAFPVWPPTPYKRPKPGTLLHLGKAFGVSIERPDAFKLCTYNGDISLEYVAWE